MQPPPEPSPTRFDLRGRLFGAPIRIHPLFWPAAALLGWPYYADPDQGSIGLFFLWTLCGLLSLLVHEFGHIAMGRLFGARLHIVLYGLGSWIGGTAALRRRPQRLAVYLAGPLLQLLVFGLLFRLVMAEPPEFPRKPLWLGWLIGNALAMFMLFSFYWAVLNLLPIWPLDGGLFLREWCEGLLGPIGPVIALAVCLLVSFGIALRVGHWASTYLPYLYDPHGSMVLQAYAIVLIFCVFFLVSGFRALRAEYRHWRGRTMGTSRRP